MVRGAGPFGGDHRRAQGRLRRTLLTERGTVVRLLLALEDLAADAERRLLGLDRVDLEPALGVVVAILVAQLVAALRDQADPAPLAVADLEDVLDQPSRRRVPLGPDGAGVWVLDLRPALLQLEDRAVDAFQEVDTYGMSIPITPFSRLK